MGIPEDWKIPVGEYGTLIIAGGGPWCGGLEPHEEHEGCRGLYLVPPPAPWPNSGNGHVPLPAE